MKKACRTGLIALLCTGGTLLQTPVNAHHSFSAEFDPSTNAELTGVVSEVRYANPHVRYRIDVNTEDGSQETWELQTSSVTSLREQGWTRGTLEMGDRVTVSGQLGRNGAKKLFVRGGTLADGTPFGAAAAADEPRRDPDVVHADPDTDYGRVQVNPDHPFDISGPWRNSYKFRVTVDDFEPKPTPFTAEGRRLYENNEKYDDPGLRCMALGLPRVFGSPYNLDIIDAGDHYLFYHVYEGAMRRIWMDGRDIPEDARLTSMGYSVGHWEDDRTLVIETRRLLPGWLDGSGLPMSGEGTRTVEHYRFSEDRLSADRTLTVHDPLYTAPLVRTRGMAREDGLDVREQDSCDPTSYYVDLYESGQIEDYLGL